MFICTLIFVYIHFVYISYLDGCDEITSDLGIHIKMYSRSHAILLLYEHYYYFFLKNSSLSFVIGVVFCVLGETS